ncbi:MAG TPA: M28 family metallopeptidase [Methylomirabilota bacterium]|nr:M28 family metallopeptidase [Methylomirabilota bacterium]
MRKSVVVSLGAAAVGLAATGVLTSGAGEDWEALGKRWWAHVQYLADDKLEGRDTGSRGFAKAAAYVTEEFRRAGLKPGGTRGYAQPVEFAASQLDEANSSLELLRGGKAEPVKFGEEAFLTVNSDTAKETEAEAVFAGYGLVVPELKYDDLAGLDVKGKIVFFVTGGPPDMPGPVKAHFQSQEERRRVLTSAGAIGVASIQNPKAAEVPWSRTAGGRFNPRMEPAPEIPPTKPITGYRFSMTVNPEHAEKFFAGSGHGFEEILAAINTGKPLPHFPLAVKVHARVAAKRWTVKSQNTVGVWRGSDPAVSDEYVVISAHLDHLGVGEPVNGDRIYNGAMDDASGVASLIEIARALKESGAKPRRSILFVAVTGEEKGLLGSRYFAEHPTVPAKNILADLNMDMFLPLFPLKYLEVQGLGESTLGDDLREVAAARGVEVQADKEPEHNRFIRSDQYSFIRKGIPALAFKFGYLPGTPEEKTFQAWYRERYHGPTDDANQPVDAAAAAQFNAILEALALRVADAEKRPEWKQGSFFRRFAQ